MTGAPTSVDPSVWSEETLNTPVGPRVAMKNETHTNIEFLPDYADTIMTTWIDKDSGVLLKITDVVDILATGSLDMTSTTTIELTNADFLSLLGFLQYFKILGIPLLYILIGLAVLIIIIILVVIIIRRRR